MKIRFCPKSEELLPNESRKIKTTPEAKKHVSEGLS
jgi:hypothetical protein